MKYKIMPVLLALLALSPGANAASNRRPAAGNASEHINSTCPFATDSLAFSPGATWRADGKARFNKKYVKSESFSANSQTAILKARGVPFAAPGKDANITQVRLEYSNDGKLSLLELEDSRSLRMYGKPASGNRSLQPEWRQTMEYTWNGDDCSVKRVSVNAPELAGKTGVSFDQDLCRAFESKGLLDEKKIDECVDYNDRMGKEIEKATKEYGDQKAFALFTTDPSGRTSIRAWQKKDHLSVNASIARDCAYHLKKGQRASNPGSSAPDQESIRSGTTAR
jgi:hypothetical protein